MQILFAETNARLPVCSAERNADPSIAANDGGTALLCAGDSLKYAGDLGIKPFD